MVREVATCRKWVAANSKTASDDIYSQSAKDKLYLLLIGETR